jgi:hypothetical protein
MTPPLKIFKADLKLFDIATILPWTGVAMEHSITKKATRIMDNEQKTICQSLGASS